jgi:hypothetical protein
MNGRTSMKLFTWITDRLNQYSTPTAEKAMCMNAIVREEYSEKLFREKMREINLEIKREIKAGRGFAYIGFPYDDQSYMFRRVCKHLCKKGYYVSISFGQISIDWR